MTAPCIELTFFARCAGCGDSPNSPRGHEQSLIFFDVPSCDQQVRIEGDRFRLRISAKTPQVSEPHVRMNKSCRELLALDSAGPESGPDRLEVAADRPELLPGIPDAVKAPGTRSRRGPLRGVIASLCRWRPLWPAGLGAILGIPADNLTKRHLTQMVAEGRLRRLFPDEPTHPNQAFAAAGGNDDGIPP